jgi:hypothetical protein
MFGAPLIAKRDEGEGTIIVELRDKDDVNGLCHEGGNSDTNWGATIP